MIEGVQINSHSKLGLIKLYFTVYYIIKVSILKNIINKIASIEAI